MPPVVPFVRPCDECQIGPRIAVNGYARVPSGRRGVWLYAHRVAWEKVNGPIPPGAHIHHTCGTKACVNPAHLELKSSMSEHMKEHPSPRKCDHDDRFIDSRGKSVCRTCRRQQRNDRYRNDPEFRAKTIAWARAREATLTALGVKRIRVR